MRTEPQQPSPEAIEALVLDLLIRHYPAQLSEADIAAHIATAGDDQNSASIVTQDALRQLQADRLVRLHGRYFAASLVAVKAQQLLAP